MANGANEIRAFRGDYWFLSNFYPCTVIHDGLEFRNLEAAFQAAKCADLSARIGFGILEPADAKKLGRTVTLRSDWEKVKLFILKELVRIKFYCNPELLGALLATGNAMLFEDNTWHDNYYGNCVCPHCQGIQGLNNLGHTLMQLRDQLLHTINCFNGGLFASQASE